MGVPHGWHSTRVSFSAVLPMHIPMAQTVFLHINGQYIFDISVQNMQECLDLILIYLSSPSALIRPCTTQMSTMFPVGLSDVSNAGQTFPIGPSISDAG